MGRLGRFSTRGRDKGHRHRNPFVIIACEGNFNNKTEKTYFKNFNSKNCMIRFSNGNSTDPVGIVNDLLNFIDTDVGRVENDKYYAVFDTDINKNNQNQIEEAIKIAENNGIEIIISTPAFEFWYILHYGYTTKIYNSNEEVIEDLRNKGIEYRKNMNLYPKLKERTKQAINNAKKIEKFHIENGQSFYSSTCNPYTAVYRVVEELIRRNN